MVWGTHHPKIVFALETPLASLAPMLSPVITRIHVLPRLMLAVES